MYFELNTLLRGSHQLLYTRIPTRSEVNRPPIISIAERHLYRRVFLKGCDEPATRLVWGTTWSLTPAGGDPGERYTCRRIAFRAYAASNVS